MHDDTIINGSGLSLDVTAIGVRAGSLTACKSSMDKLIADLVVRRR